MSRKLDPAEPRSPSRSPREELRLELERNGLAPEHAGALADQLQRLAGELPRREYRALLDSVLSSQRAQRLPPTPELHRLLEDFAAELRKLDEGLRLLASFLTRLREQTATPRESRTLH